MSTNNLFEKFIENEVNRITIIVLGCKGVGKTALIRQFIKNDFCDVYHPTESCVAYYTSFVFNDHIYEVKVVDCAMIAYFPSNSLGEWTDYRGYNLRKANAYILAFDVTSDESFHYIRSIREQMVRSLDMKDIALIVAGNKHDLISGERSTQRRDTAAFIKKHWKCGYVEISAKYNWKVNTLFRELMTCVHHNQYYGHKLVGNRVQDALRNNRCVIL